MNWDKKNWKDQKLHIAGYEMCTHDYDFMNYILVLYNQMGSDLTCKLLQFNIVVGKIDDYFQGEN